MRRGVAWLVVPALLSWATADPLTIRWYKCTFSTVESKSAAKDVEEPLMAECADIRMPLCHPGVCGDKSHDISVFVKRLPARTPRSPPQALWMLQGGPGHASTAMESLMHNSYEASNGTISVYTMDHRGTGRSTLLECPEETHSEDEIVDCLEAIKKRHGRTPSSRQPTAHQISVGNDAPKGFSVTSAATDLQLVVESSLFNSTEVYVYGVSYGTYLVERLMHLAPKQVKGYILDSIQSEQFYTTKSAPYYSNWDRDVYEVVHQFFAYCDADAFCKGKIGPKSKQTLLQTYLALDAAQTECFDILYKVAHDGGYAKPSGVVGQTLYNWLTDREKRGFIPAYIFRLGRCNADDQVWLQQLTYPPAMEIPDESPYLKGTGYSDVVYNNIVFSEIWQSSPSSPTAQELYEDSVNALLSLGNIVYAKNRAQIYCIYKQNADPMCKEYPMYDVSFTYDHDAYWNHTASIPEGTSVLMFTGALDTATPSKYAHDENATMGGGAKKRLIEFPFANHGVVMNTPDEDNEEVHCGVLILDSYLAKRGDVAAIDTSCVDHMEKLKFSHWDRDLAFELFGSENPYNQSVVQVKLSAIIKNKLKTAFTTGVVVLTALLVVSVGVLIFVVLENRALRQQLIVSATAADSARNLESQPLTTDDAVDITEVTATTTEVDDDQPNASTTTTEGTALGPEVTQPTLASAENLDEHNVQV
ncbi:unnamed protein product [Aphanomyces euteiches]